MDENEATVSELPAEARDDLVAALAAMSDAEAAAAVEDLCQRRDAATVAALRPLAESERPAVASAAISALGRLGTPESATALAIVGDRVRGKELRKLARRTLHRLTAVGVRPSAVPRADEPRQPGMLRTDYAPHRGLVSTIDGAGNRLVQLALAEPAGGIVVLDALTNEEQGLRQFVDRRRGRRRFEDELRRRLGDKDPLFVEVPAEYARFLLYEALSAADREHLAVPVEIVPWHALIVARQPSYQRALIYEHLNPAELRWNPTYLEESPKLLEQPEFEGWTLQPEQVAPFDPETQAREARIVLPGPGRREQTDSAVDRAIAALFDAGARQRWRRRLEEMAYVLLHCGGERNARRALAAALALAPSDLAPVLGAVPARHPMLAALVEEGFDLLRRTREQGLVRQGRLWVPRGAD